MKKISLLIVLLVIINFLVADQLTVQRERALLRDGPGSFFSILAELPQGKEFNRIDEFDHWYEIEVDSLQGFVSQKVVTARSNSSYDAFKQMSESTASIIVSKHGMSAGIKGFAEKYSNKYSSGTQFIDLYQTFKLDPKIYKKFRKETYADKNRNYFKKRVKLPDLPDQDYYKYEEEGLGLAIAASIVSNIPLYDNPQMLEYVNSVGFILVEASNVYDMQFKFYVLDTVDANAYACPGGMIFITRGMLDNIHSEAELAAILAHEIGHVALRHGLIELGEREMWIKADDAFADMEAEFEDAELQQPDEITEIENELEEIAFQSYNRVIEGRLDKYEKDADFYSLKLAARAGYKSWQIITILDRLHSVNTKSGNEHYTQDQIEIRIQDLWKVVEKMEFSDHLFDKKERWISHQI